MGSIMVPPFSEALRPCKERITNGRHDQRNQVVDHADLATARSMQLQVSMRTYRNAGPDSVREYAPNGCRPGLIMYAC